MKTLSKVGVVLGGYAAAFSVACVLVYIRQLRTSGPDAQASAGMYAWGDFTLFVTSFTVMALIPTALGLYFLRPYKNFWIVLSVAAIAVAITGPVGAALSALCLNFPRLGSPWQMLGALGFLRAMGAPLLAMTFLVCAAFAPAKRPRWAMLTATVFECAASSYFYVHMWLARAPYGP
jgi:hypothetical protein